MIGFLIRKVVVGKAQKTIVALTPSVALHVPDELPLPSVSALQRYATVASRINGLESAMAALSDDAMREKTVEFRRRYTEAVRATAESLAAARSAYEGATDPEDKNNRALEVERVEKEHRAVKKEILSALLPEAFALVREAGTRVLSMRHFDVQLVGGMVLHDGGIAEMTTGEGKTLVATLPVYLNALTGEGVHVVTVNDYLAQRDRDWMGPIYEFLGLTVGAIQHDMDPQMRQRMYGCDITYGTNNEFGFDYLRDNMVNFKQDMVQRGHHYAVVDEVDSILVDEARTPLIISGPAEESTDKYYRANEIVKRLKGKRITDQDEIDAKYKEIDLAVGVDYLANEKTKTISLTEQGEQTAAQLFGIANLHDMETIEFRHHILQAVKAHEFFSRDVDYVVREGEVIIVDEFTGRMMPGRRWSDGLHQAVEAKEGMKIERENQTLATITFQNYFRLYEKLSGMTGTAYTEAAEFKEIYSLDCVVIPTNKPVQRKNFADAIYRTAKEKHTAVVAEIEECYKRGQPVLVGTISIEKSEVLSRMLSVRGIKHEVLNAKYHEREAQIIAQAGRFKAVTIATNMAGRGTDIMLGGNAEFLAKTLAHEQAKDDSTERDIAESMRQFVERFRRQVKDEHEKVIAAGGLHVIGTERHESRRIDNQLRGRQGRQGDPGSSRFYVSLEDDLMRLFASDRLIGIMNSLGMEEGQVLEHPWLTKALETAQRRVEAQNFEIRKHLLEFDNVMNRQREVIYDLRRTVLESADVKHLIVQALEDAVEASVQQYVAAGTVEGEPDVEGLAVYLKQTFGYELGDTAKRIPDMSQDETIALLAVDVTALYEQKEKEIGSQQLRYLERMLLLHTIDSKWKDHLYAMDQLKSGINLRSFAQRDPLIEYKREGFEMFQMMYGSIDQDVAETIFKLKPAEPTHHFRGVFSSLPQRLVHDEVAGLSQRQGTALPEETGPAQSAALPSAPVQHGEQKVGRNETCPCGSGKKYKKCCGR